MVKQALNLRIKGLYTHQNPLSEVPAGGLVIATNVLQPREGLLDQRRGFATYGAALTLGTGERPNTMFNFKNRRLIHFATTLAYDSDGAGTWTAYSGTHSPPTGVTRIKTIQANKNLYFTTSAGIKKLDSLTGAVGSAGTPKALDISLALSGATGFMNNNSQVAYRAVWGIKDSNNNLILGAPSQRAAIANASGGTRNMTVTVTIPAGITTSHFIQIYRSQMTATASETPNDEMQLVYEAKPTSGEISAKSLSFTDITPESLRGATLYTSPSQEGIAQANDQPPLAKDIAVYKNMALFANTVSKHRITITLITVGGTGLVNDDTVVIGGVTYTGKATETASSGQFKVETGLTPAENIEATALSLVRVINTYASNTSYYAYYLSGYNDLPGIILIEERSIGGAGYALTSSRGGAFSPVLPTSGTSVSTSNETAKNRLHISKVLQPEAAPLLQYLNIGSADADILRVIPLRDSVFIWKADGLYRMVGEDPTTLRVSLFDNTVSLLAPDSAVAFNNQVFAFTDQGIAAASDNGVAVVSRDIEATLLELASSQYTHFASATWAVAYESERTYWLFTVGATTDTHAVQAWTYNSFANSWTGPHPLERSCGVVGDDDDRLYLGSADTDFKYIYRERKSFTETDYADEEYAVTITNSSGTTVTLSSTTNCVAGQTLAQSTRKAVITEVTDGTHLEVSKTLSWAAAAAKVYNPISVSIKSAPLTVQNPGLIKQFPEMSFFFRQATFASIDVGFSSNLSTYREDTAISPVSEGAWGTFPWGGLPWGGAPPEIQPIRTFVPLEKQVCHWLNYHLTHAEALSTFSFAGVSAVYEPIDTRMS